VTLDGFTKSSPKATNPVLQIFEWGRAEEENGKFITLQTDRGGVPISLLGELFGNGLELRTEPRDDSVTRIEGE
jgi:hypothetical protein